jgi:hypothetical protein
VFTNSSAGSDGLFVAKTVLVVRCLSWCFRASFGARLAPTSTAFGAGASLKSDGECNGGRSCWQRRSSGDR